MTKTEARDHFKSLGLTYNDITLDDLHYLKILVDLQFLQVQKWRMQAHCKFQYWIRVNDSKHYNGQYTPDGKMICAYMTGEGAYFDSREVISFNRDGFIGFCGAADSENTQPVLAAFIEWCDWLATKGE